MSKTNISKTYLLPLLSQSINIDYSFAKYITQTYMYDNEGIHDKCIFIEHIFDIKDPKFTKYEHLLTSHPLFKELYDLKDDKVVYVFNFPPEFINEYNLFEKGIYSKFGEDSKENILFFWTKVYEENPYIGTILKQIKDILYKDPLYRVKLAKSLSDDNNDITIEDDAELGNLITIEDETFNITEAIKYKSHINDIAMKFKIPN